MVGRLIFENPERQKLYERLWADYKRLLGRDFDEDFLNSPNGKKYRKTLEQMMKKKG
jgi:hypothetical protein